MWINAKFDSECSECTRSIREGDRISWDPEEKTVVCEPCVEKAERRSAEPIRGANVVQVSDGDILVALSKRYKTDWATVSLKLAKHCIEKGIGFP